MGIDYSAVADAVLLLARLLGLCVVYVVVVIKTAVILAVSRAMRLNIVLVMILSESRGMITEAYIMTVIAHFSIFPVTSLEVPTACGSWRWISVSSRTMSSVVIATMTPTYILSDRLFIA